MLTKLKRSNLTKFHNVFKSNNFYIFLANLKPISQSFKQSHRLVFDDTHVVRIRTAWSCFAVSFVGNFLVLLCVTVWRKNLTKTHTQTLMLNISIANLCFTCVVMPTGWFYLSYFFISFISDYFTYFCDLKKIIYAFNQCSLFSILY